MKLQFSQATKEKLKYYVYLLIDPRTRKIFYIGKGIGNRCFNHIEEAMRKSSKSEKTEQIRKIIKSKKQVIIKILRHNLTNQESLLVESSCIDLLKTDLKNIVLGHDSGEFGLMSTQEVEQIYSAKKLKKSDIKHKIILININNAYRDNNEDLKKLYEVTRKAWKINYKRASQAQYAIVTYKGVSRAVFKITSWAKSKSEIRRYEFIGTTAEENIAKMYNNKSITNFVKKGAQNPIKYCY